MALKGRPPKILPFSEKLEQGIGIAGAPPCPKDLCKVGKKKWAELVKELDAAGILTKLDGDVLRDYVLAYVEEQQAREMLAASGNPFVLSSETTGAIYINPIRHIINKARDQMVRLRQELGLAPVSRTRLKIAATKPTAGVVSRDRMKGPPPPPPKGEMA